MPVIKVLPKSVAELIAAGEVVERPSSVIKELVENSIDAGSTLVTVEIKNGGVTYMRVTDNGCGIRRSDVTVAFKRHATSKVSTDSDLNAIATLGFRGEALAAISSVSRIQMMTKTRDEDDGTLYTADGGEGVNVSDAGCPDGTTVIVRDLFFNTPARMKFLKKDVAEGNSVGAVLDHIALSHPEISFRFIRDGKNVFSTPGDGKLMSAIYEVLGREFASGLIPVNTELDGVKVSGYVCRPTCCRPKKNAQFIFLNGRFVRSGTVAQALETAYKNCAMVGRFPAAVLHITVPYEAVDINVHPAKTEVRFADERRVFDCVMFGVRNALQSGDKRPEMTVPAGHKQIRMTAEEYRQTVLPDTGKKQVDPLAAFEKMIGNTSAGAARESVMRSGGAAEIYNRPAFSEKADGKSEKTPETQKYYEMPEAKYGPAAPVTAKTVAADIKVPTESKTVTDAVPVKEVTPTSDKIPERIEYIGEAFSTYIIARKGESLFIIDKHAAHERMLFNELKKNAESSRQLLLTPRQIRLEREDYTVICESTELLAKAGFEVEDYGDSTVLVRAVPAMLINENVESMIFEICDSLSKKHAVELDRLERIYETVACRAAVKGGNFSAEGELRLFAEKVLSSDEIMYCPHGRPVAMELKRREIEKQFGRIQ